MLLDTASKKLEIGYASISDKIHENPSYTLTLCTDNSAFMKIKQGK